MVFSMPLRPFEAGASLSTLSVVPPPGLARVYTSSRSKKKSLSSSKKSRKTQPHPQPQPEPQPPSIPPKDTNVNTPSSTAAYPPFRGNLQMDTWVHLLYSLTLYDENSTNLRFSFLIDAARTFLGRDWKKRGGYSPDKPVPYDIWSCPCPCPGAKAGVAVAQERAVVVLEESASRLRILSDVWGGRYVRIPVEPDEPATSQAQTQADDGDDDDEGGPSKKLTSSVEVFDLLLTRGSNPIRSSESQGNGPSRDLSDAMSRLSVSSPPNQGSLLRADWVDRPPAPESTKSSFVVRECSCGSRRTVRISDAVDKSKDPTPTSPSDTSNNSNGHKTGVEGAPESGANDDSDPNHHAEGLEFESGFTDSPHWDDFKHRSRLVRRAERDLGWFVPNDWKSRVMVDDERIVILTVRADFTFHGWFHGGFWK